MIRRTQDHGYCGWATRLQIYQMFDKNVLLTLLKTLLCMTKESKRYVDTISFMSSSVRRNRLAKQRGGIVWHTRGSGKTLTMVWLSKWILANCQEENPHVLIVTDRDELDEQIENIISASMKKSPEPRAVMTCLKMNLTMIHCCSLVHKFGRRGGEATSLIMISILMS